MLNWLKRQLFSTKADSGCCGGCQEVKADDIIRGLEAGLAALEREVEFERQSSTATLGCLLAAAGGSIYVPDGLAEEVLKTDFTIERHTSEGGETIRLVTQGTPQ